MSSVGSGGTVRTCVGCRRRATKSELLRVVVGDRGAGLELVPDPDRRAPGRGAHLHPTTGCLELALRRRAFPRALKTQGSVGRLTTTALEDFVLDSTRGDQRTVPARPTRNWSSSS